MVWVNDVRLRYCLGEGYECGGPFADTHIELIGNPSLVNARLGTETTCGARPYINVSGLLPDGDMEVAYLTPYVDNLGVRHEIYVGMVANLDHLRCQDTGRTVQSWESLIELSHVTADGGFPLNQDGPKPFIGDIQGGLHPRDAGPDNNGLGNTPFLPRFFR